MKKYNYIKILLFTLLISFTFYSCKKANNNTAKPNIIVFIADDVSWDDIGSYGNDFVKTPNIDKLAKNGIRFTNAYLTTSSCSPSRNSIITGRYPHNTGAAELHTEPPLDMISLPEILKDNGYYTLQAGKFHMGKYAKRGFDEVHDKKSINGLGGENYWVKAVENRPIDKPFFMWFASYDAHRIWGENNFSGTHNLDEINVPEYLIDGPLTRKDLADYYDEIARFDFHIGKVVELLKKQGQFEETIIIIMADNGRPFPHSKTRLNDQGIKTPFIIHYPKIVSLNNKVSNSLLSSIDIAPTLIDLANINSFEKFQGISFKDILMDPSKDFRNYVFAEHNWHDYEAYQRMVRDDRYLYILNSRPEFPQLGPLDAINSRTYIELRDAYNKGIINDKQLDIFISPRPNEELYDLDNDPYQFNNLINGPDLPKNYITLKSKLNEWIESTGDDIPDSLTKDWYLIEQEPYNETSLLKTKHHGIRGVMPGHLSNAINNNNKGPF